MRTFNWYLDGGVRPRIQSLDGARATRDTTQTGRGNFAGSTKSKRKLPVPGDPSQGRVTTITRYNSPTLMTDKWSGDRHPKRSPCLEAGDGAIGIVL